MRRPTAVIADDDMNLIRLLRAVLEPMGVDVQETQCAVAALDVNMPTGSRLSVCEMLSSSAHYIQKDSDAIEQVKQFAAQTLSLSSPKPCMSERFTG